MGTRSLTRVIEEYNYGADEVITVMYRQYDGYPSGHGMELAEFLDGMVVVNGIGMTENRKIANGMGCLAAQLVSHFKDGPGGIYLYNPSATDCGQEYEYELKNDGDTLNIRVIDTWDKKIIFDGGIEDFKSFCNEN